MSTQGGISSNKLKLVLSIIRFLRDESKAESSDVAESLEVAIQCLEAAFSVDFATQTSLNDRYDAFLDAFDLGPAASQNLLKAEEHKTLGNELMRNSKYAEAVAEYTKAITINPKNAVYFCNRAAAYSRLNNHDLALADCQESVRLDPTYGKAYGRLGIAYSNLNQYTKARDAYKKALELDPTNQTYSENLALAQEQIESSGGRDGIGGNLMDLMSNPNLLNVAAQMLNDPSVSNVMSSILGENGRNPNLETLMQMGQQLAQQMQINNPGLVDNLRRQFTDEQSENHPEEPPADKNNKKDC